MSNIIINVNNVSKRYKYVRREKLFRKQQVCVDAVSNISFQIEKGSKVAIIGPNGAGKSTLIKMMCGILSPTNDSIEIMEKNPFKERRKVCKDISCLFGQRSQLVYDLPILDTLMLYGSIYELDKEELLSRIEYLKNVLEISDIMEQPVRKLSLGQRMKCELAAALINNPKILFLDEPTIGLDVVSKNKLKSVINDMHKRNKMTIILTSHDSGDIEELCERVIVINKGKKVIDTSVSNLLNNYIRKKIVTCKASDLIDVQVELGKCSVQQGIGNELKIEVDKEEVNDVINQILSISKVNDITIENYPLEKVITYMYEHLNAGGINDEERNN